ncbi:hypothetical protein [Spirosoma sp.]|uniref:hypothetical protein n=1 Tax=Spirosoma sp. TaxID=1899569 RepID=UPI003B3B6E5F
MVEKVTYVRQETSWLSGLLALWLMVSFQSRLDVAQRITDRQTYLSCTALWQQTDESDYAPNDNVHTHLALVYPTSGFVFTTSTGFLPCSRYSLPKNWRTNVVTAIQQSPFIFEILRLIFEHQIAINAP